MEEWVSSNSSRSASVLYSAGKEGKRDIGVFERGVSLVCQEQRHCLVSSTTHHACALLNSSSLLQAAPREGSCLAAHKHNNANT